MSRDNVVKSDAIRELLSSMTSSSLDNLISRAHEEQRNRLHDDQDEEYLLDLALRKGFDGGGSPQDPFEVAPGIIALPSSVKDTSSVRHRCTHYTVRPDEESPEEYWSWDERCPTHLRSDTNKVEKLRTSVALHAMSSGALITRHVMEHDGERHVRKGSRAWKVDLNFDQETQEPKVTLTPAVAAASSKLPAPEDR